MYLLTNRDISVVYYLAVLARLRTKYLRLKGVTFASFLQPLAFFLGLEIHADFITIASIEVTFEFVVLDIANPVANLFLQTSTRTWRLGRWRGIGCRGCRWWGIG